MSKTLTAQSLIRKLRRKDRVLLINPPVEETRYSWLRWNQPLDLLKIGGYVQSEIGCAVALLDFLQPDAKGDVPEQWLPRDRRYVTVGDHRYPMRHFGRPFTELQTWTEEDRKSRRQAPTQVWITSLCTFWHDSIAQTCRAVREMLPDVSIALFGQYPQLLPKHAALTCAADFIVTKALSLDNARTALDLYGKNTPRFLAVQVRSSETIRDIKAAIERGITDVAFFEEDLLEDCEDTLRQIVDATEGLHRHLRYHFLCGVHPSKVSPSNARLLAHRKVAQVHFEEASDAEALDLDAYRKARVYLQEAGMNFPTDRVSGFAWIGRPSEQLDQLILKSFQVLDLLGNLILKPFSPTPGSPEHKKHGDYLDRRPLREWSPHFFPFSELNGITRDEYHDLYRMAAFLNEKVRDRSFDFLEGTLGAEMLRESLRKEVWNLEPSPLRVID